MGPDDDICYCFHVSLRKLLNFARRVRPSRASQLSDCLGAGTGCGWCIPFLKRITENPDAPALRDVQPDDYATQRDQYIQSGQPKNRF